jgi:hypothetical protein
VGFLVGSWVGLLVLGTSEGDNEGFSVVGLFDGLNVGLMDGDLVGCPLGDFVGSLEGLPVINSNSGAGVGVTNGIFVLSIVNGDGDIRVTLIAHSSCKSASWLVVMLHP